MLRAISVDGNKSTFNVSTAAEVQGDLPVNAVGEIPKFIAVTASDNCFFILGPAGVSVVKTTGAGAKSIMLNGAIRPTIFRVDGETDFAMQKGSGGNVIFTITAMENEGGSAAAAGTP